MNSKETSKGKFGMRRTAMALAVASALGLGTNAAFATTPNITLIAIPNVTMKVGDSVTATITVGDDGGDAYTLNGGSTIGGFDLSNLARTNNTTYTADFTVTEGGTDVVAGADIPVSVTLTGAASAGGNNYTTAISQAADLIDAHTPSYTSASINGANTVVTLTFDEALVNNTADLAALKAAITFAADGTTFGALLAGDSIAIVGSTVTVTFATPLTGSANKVKIDASSLKDAAANVVTGITTTAAVATNDITTATPAASSVNSGSYTPPPQPTSVTPGGTATIGSNTTPVTACVGSTLNVTSGTSGATINLPTPPTTGATATDAVNVAIGGNNLSVKPTESGSVVKTATVSIGGKDTTVLNVTAGTAQVSASVANQPLVSVGSGANAVVISSGSASATVITSVDKTTGVTSLTLPKSTTTNDADASVTMTIGGQNMNVQPSGGNDVVVTLKTVTVNGVSTQVVSVTGGSATVTSSQPNQPLLAVGGGSGSNAIVVTADTAGTAATSTVNVGTGETFIAVSSGVVTLPTNAFAEIGNGFAAADNGFAAIKDGKIYAGEIAVLNSAGKITGVRLGSQSGAAAYVGDPVNATIAGVTGLTMNVAVPNLKGKVARVSDSQDFSDAIAAALGTGYVSNGQNSNGVLSLTTPTGAVINAWPAGDIIVDTSRADGVIVSGNGRKEVAKNGVIVNLAPAVSDITQFAGHVVTLDKGANVAVNDYGVLQAGINGITYGVQPAWAVSKAVGGSAGFTTDAQGQVVYQDGAGNLQTLYPVFIDLGQVIAAFKPMDAYARATGNADGTITAKLLNKTYTLLPEYVLISVPAEHTNDAWWLDNGKVFVKNSNGKTAQGFSVK